MHARSPAKISQCRPHRLQRLSELQCCALRAAGTAVAGARVSSKFWHPVHTHNSPKRCVSAAHGATKPARAHGGSSVAAGGPSLDSTRASLASPNRSASVCCAHIVNHARMPQATPDCRLLPHGAPPWRGTSLTGALAADAAFLCTRESVNDEAAASAHGIARGRPTHLAQREQQQPPGPRQRRSPSVCAGTACESALRAPATRYHLITHHPPPCVRSVSTALTAPLCARYVCSRSSGGSSRVW